MTTLRSSLIRLAAANPDLQPHLLPLLVEPTDRVAGEDKVRVLNENGRKVWVSRQTLRDPKEKGKYKPLKEKSTKETDKPKGSGKGAEPEPEPEPEKAADKPKSRKGPKKPEKPETLADLKGKATEMAKKMKDPEDKKKTLERIKKMDAKDLKGMMAGIGGEDEEGGGKTASLRSSLIRLAAANPDLRPSLLPLLAEPTDKVAFGRLSPRDEMVIRRWWARKEMEGDLMYTDGETLVCVEGEFSTPLAVWKGWGTFRMIPTLSPKRRMLQDEVRALAPGNGLMSDDGPVDGAVFNRVAAKAPKAAPKLKGKKLDDAISKAYYRNGNGVQVNIMDIGKIYDAGKKAYEAADTVEAADAALEEAMKAAIAKFRQN